LTQTPPLVSALIDTQALQVAPGDEVFWYTSGTVGPYYINTHYLYGGQQPAQELLEFIDETKDDPHKLPQALYNRVTKMYDADPSYRVVIDALAGLLQSSVRFVGRQKNLVHVDLAWTAKHLFGGPIGVGLGE